MPASLEHRGNGAKIQAYRAIVVCLLISIQSCRTSTKRTFETICFHLNGWASLDELERHIEKLNMPKKPHLGPSSTTHAFDASRRPQASGFKSSPHSEATGSPAFW